MDIFFKRIFQTSKQISLSSVAASLAFYTTLSIPPLVVLFIASIQYLQLPLEKVINNELDHLLVGEVAVFLKLILDKDDLLSHYKKFGDGFGIIIVLFSASLIFRELRRSFNIIFHRHKQKLQIQTFSKQVFTFIKREIFPLAAVLIFIVLLLVYLTSSSSISFLIPLEYKSKWLIYHNAIAFLFFTFTFAFLFRYSPDQKTPWMQSLIGGLITTIFCMIGTHFVGVYIAKLFVFNFFGIFGPLFLFLIWVYYSYFMILMGAIVCASF